MRTPWCHTFLAFILKFLNFLQAFLGVAIIIYSAYMLSQWHHHQHQVLPPDFPGILLPADGINPLNSALNSLPAPWFIYAFMGIGILVCCITCIGHIGAEAISGCCLCFYAVLTTIFILLEVGLVAFIAIDHHWEKDIPVDPTGELDSFRNFIEDNVDVFKWVGIAIVVIQMYCYLLGAIVLVTIIRWNRWIFLYQNISRMVLSLLIAIILRSLLSGRREDDDIEGDYDSRNSTREPLITPYSNPASGSTRGDSDIWSSRMRQKYGLNSNDTKHILPTQNPSTDVKQ